MLDNEVKWTGVHLRVLGGRPVWPLAFHLFMMAGDRREFVAQRMECVDFVPARYASGSAVARRLDEILEGDCGWGSAQLSVAEADCVLASLGLLHMRVKCVIPEELGGDYEPAVSARVPGDVRRGGSLTGAVVFIAALVGHGRDVGGVVRSPPVK